MNAPWQIELLGRLRAVQGECVITRFRTRKAGLLLARLALFPRRAHPREELCDLLWPDVDLETGRSNLRQALASLRRQLEPPGTSGGSVLIADRHCLQLNPNAVIADVGRFENALKAGRLAEAEALYVGELLPGFYDDWVIDERERLAAVLETARIRLEKQMGQTVPSVSPDETPSENILLPFVPGDTGGLPMQFTRFFGRDRELETLDSWLQDPHTRLVTLMGPGGVGKTRLATEAARQMRCACPQLPVCFAPLADLSDSSLIAGAVADALGLPPRASDDALSPIVEALHAFPGALLVLDNLEQLGAGGAQVVRALLSRLPRLVVLATSRHRLAVAGEREFPLAPLPTPEDADLPAEQVAAFPAVQLFVDRAQAIRPDFQVTPANAPAVAALCAGLEGLPLALELVAARSRSLTPAQMLRSLSSRFALLATRRTDRDARHRSLWAAIEWSVELLPAPLRRFWIRLAVFRGGCTARAAAEVCGEPEALDSLTRLQERSLLTAEQDSSGDEMRFRVFESLREWAAEQTDAEQRETLAARHAAWCLGLTDQAADGLRGPEQAAWLTRLEAEQDNLRAALEWSKHADLTLALHLSAVLARFWQLRDQLREGRAQLNDVLALTEDDRSAARAATLHSAAVLALHQGDYAQAYAWAEGAHALYSQRGEAARVLSIIATLGAIAYYRRDLLGARRFYEEGLVLARVADDPHNMATLLGNLGGLVLEMDGDRDAARGHFQEAIALHRTTGHRGGLAHFLRELASLAAVDGDNTAARACFEESLSLARALGDRKGIAETLFRLGELFLRLGQQAAADTYLQDCLELLPDVEDRRSVERILGQYVLLCAAQGHLETALRALGTLDTVWPEGCSPGLQESLDGVFAQASATLGQKNADALRAAGRARPWTQMVAEAQ